MGGRKKKSEKNVKETRKKTISGTSWTKTIFENFYSKKEYIVHLFFISFTIC